MPAELIEPTECDGARGFTYFLPDGGPESFHTAGLNDRFPRGCEVSVLTAGGAGPDGLAGRAFHAGPTMPTGLSWQAAQGHRSERTAAAGAA